MNYLYTLTIREHHAQGTPDEEVETVLRIDVSPPEPRIIEMSLQSSTNIPLNPAALPRPDLAGIAAALSTAFASDGRSASSTSKVIENAAPTVADLAPMPTMMGARDVAADADRHTTAGRAYRKMPAPDELRSTFKAVGTVSNVARHYGVPRHTAQGWITRLRKLSSDGTGDTPSTQIEE